MTLGSAVKVLLRRWLVIVIGLVLTVGAAGYLYLNTPPRYQATARMLLLLPADARGEEAIGSPFLFLPNGLNVLARIVATTPTSQEFQAGMVGRGLTSQYEVGVDTASPTLTVSVEGIDPANVIATRDGVITAIQSELLRVQQDEAAPTNQVAHARIYAAERTPEQIGGDRMRGVLAVAGALGLLTLLAAFLIDRLSQILKARKKRRGERPRVKKVKGAAPVADTAPDALEEDSEATATGVTLGAPIRDAYPEDETSDEDETPVEDDAGQVPPSEPQGEGDEPGMPVEPDSLPADLVRPADEALAGTSDSGTEEGITSEPETVTEREPQDPNAEPEPEQTDVKQRPAPAEPNRQRPRRAARAVNHPATAAKIRE